MRGSVAGGRGSTWAPRAASRAWLRLVPAGGLSRSEATGDEEKEEVGKRSWDKAVWSVPGPGPHAAV